jgi:SprT protein
MHDGDSALVAAIETRTHELLERAVPLFTRHSVCPPEPLIRFDLRGATAGQAQWRPGSRPVLRFNLAFARAHPVDFLVQTVPHEVAHLVTAACHGRTRPHGGEWRAVMAFFGIPNASRCHSYPVVGQPVRRQRRWTYSCRCGSHELSTTRHRRIESGRARYECRRCGAALRRRPDNPPTGASLRPDSPSLC